LIPLYYLLGTIDTFPKYLWQDGKLRANHEQWNQQAQPYQVRWRYFNGYSPWSCRAPVFGSLGAYGRTSTTRTHSQF
jgi:hypothetical protein